MSRGVQARDAIELLCKILRENGMSEIEAETLRKAKFDKLEVCAPLWRLLFELIFFCQHGLAGGDVSTCFINLDADQQVDYVKREMQRRGYLSRSFAALPSPSPAWTMTGDGGEGGGGEGGGRGAGGGGGSRELLLALGWLLAKESVIGRFMDHRASPVVCGDEDVLTLPLRGGSDEAWKAPSFDGKAGRSATVVQRVQQMLVLNNKLKMNLRLLHASQQNFANLTHKIHNSTYGVSLSPNIQHLTCMQTYMLRHPQHMTRVLRLLEEDSGRLENLLKWEEKNAVFWEWMESVLELKRQQMNSYDASAVEEKEVHHDSFSRCSIFLEVPQNIGTEISSARRSLMNKILHYESALNRLEELWASKRRTVSEWELDHLLRSLDTEICQLQASLGQSHTLGLNPSPFTAQSSSAVRPLPVPCLTLVKKIAGAGAHHHQRSSSMHRVPNDVLTAQGGGNTQEKDLQEESRSIQEEISRLQEEADRLEGELLTMRRHCLTRLTTMLTNVPSAICVLPPHLRALSTS